MVRPLSVAGDSGKAAPGLVALVRAALPDTDEALALADTFRLLGDPGRLRLLVALLEAGEMSVGDLAAATGQGESAASHALRLLRAHQVVAVRRSGRQAFYRLADSHIRMLLDLALAHARHPDTPVRDDGVQATARHTEGS
jgi:DNA-binding transcriptional ArsR family regulator